MSTTPSVVWTWPTRASPPTEPQAGRRCQALIFLPLRHSKGGRWITGSQPRGRTAGPPAGWRRIDTTVPLHREETKRLLIRDNDPARPAPEETFADRRTLNIGGERIELAWRGPNHSPDNIYIHFPDHDTLMLIDIVNPGWAPISVANLSEDIPGYVAAPAIALDYPWKQFIGGHVGRLGTRDDIALHQQYMADIDASVRKALVSVDPTPFFQKYGDNPWAAVGALFDAWTDAGAAPVIEKYKGVLAAADVYTKSTVFWVMESIRLDLGFASYVHP